MFTCETDDRKDYIFDEEAKQILTNNKYSKVLEYSNVNKKEWYLVLMDKEKKGLHEGEWY